MRLNYDHHSKEWLASADDDLRLAGWRRASAQQGPPLAPAPGDLREAQEQRPRSPATNDRDPALTNPERGGKRLTGRFRQP